MLRVRDITTRTKSTRNGYKASSTRSEYTHVLMVIMTIDSNWSREETDYLFKLVNEWDSRWYLIVDRYDYPGGKERSMEVCIIRTFIHPIFIICDRI